MLIVFGTLLGLIIGSWLNVVICRLGSKRSFWQGRSICIHCKHVLGILDLVPLLSFCALRGKCRYCLKKISWQYFLVEFFCALLFVLAILKHCGGGECSWLLVARDWMFISFLIIIFVYDLKKYLILDRVTVPAIIIALIFAVLAKISLVNVLLAGLGAGGFFLLQFLVSKGKWIGGGDIRLGFLMGLMLGWPQIIAALFLAYTLGALVGVFLLATKKKHLQSEVPFGTFLSLATVVALLYGGQILNWYLRWIGW